MGPVAARDAQHAETGAATERRGRGIPALDPVPPVALVLTGVSSIQFGAALAVDALRRARSGGDLGCCASGFAAVILLAIWRPRVRGRPAAHLRLVAIFGVMLGAMNLCFYEALDRVPLGVAVTIEFIGPIGVATLLSRRQSGLRLDRARGHRDRAARARRGRESESLDTIGARVRARRGDLLGRSTSCSRSGPGAYFDGGEGLAIAMVDRRRSCRSIPGIAEAGAALLEPRCCWRSASCVALLSSVIPYSLETEALRRMPARVFGVLMSLEPALAALAGFLVLSQGLGAREHRRDRARRHGEHRRHAQHARGRARPAAEAAIDA